MEQFDVTDGGFNTASGKYYCNATGAIAVATGTTTRFNTASGKYYCNL